VLRERGAEIVDPVTIATQPAGAGELFQWEFKTDLERYFAEWAPTASVKTLDDLVAFNRREAARELPYFQQETLEASARRGPLTSPEYLQLKERLLRQSRAEGLDATLDSNRLDAIVTVSSGPARLIDLVGGDSGGGTGVPGVTGIAASAGYPHITLPMGYVFGLPVGLSFTGRAWSEATLLRLAFAYEQASRVRRPPAFLATAALGAFAMHFLWTPQLGVYADWNLFAVVAQPIGFLVGTALAEGSLSRGRASWIAAIVVLAATHAGTWIVGNHLYSGTP